MAECTWITIPITWSSTPCIKGFTDGLSNTITDDVLINTITEETTTSS